MDNFWTMWGEFAAAATNGLMAKHGVGLKVETAVEQATKVADLLTFALIQRMTADRQQAQKEEQSTEPTEDGAPSV